MNIQLLAVIPPRVSQLIFLGVGCIPRAWTASLWPQVLGRILEEQLKGEISKSPRFLFLLATQVFFFFLIWNALPCCSWGCGINSDKESAAIRITSYGTHPIPYLGFNVFSVWFDAGGLGFVFTNDSAHGLATEEQHPSEHQVCLFQLDLRLSQFICLQMFLQIGAVKKAKTDF